MVWILGVGLFIVIFALAAAIIYLYVEFHKEKWRNRILQSFVAGIIRSFAKEFPNQYASKYKDILENVDLEFQKDLWYKPYMRWAKEDGNLFYEKKYENGGFNSIYWDFHNMGSAEVEEIEEMDRKTRAKNGGFSRGERK